ncbi:hypothetical protein E2K98_30275 [Bacillus salipaludis]|uniref:Uncharacterized protein n=1 Tax=Bacillus salipaludis TaxID=2547811 RepID=A0A4R5VHI3_9BACI|nr:hypothetical protein [Bacillus salipaludis]MDQ6596444.1 hypothetical protein [Bacillus salipaludis]TDK53362.1 hypothetical protein E2K98_30275 [Bacillus salipaludis]
MDWIDVKDSNDIENLFDKFGGFHDSCLKVLHMWTESYVDENLSVFMSPELDTNVRILFHRQYRDPSEIELLFKGVTQFHIVPSPINYDSIIDEAKLILHKGLFYWSDYYDSDPEDYTLGSYSWISAKSLKWRDASSWMGKQNRYGVINGD